MQERPPRRAGSPFVARGLAVVTIVCVVAAAVYYVARTGPFQPEVEASPAQPPWAAEVIEEAFSVAHAASDGERWVLADPRAGRVHVLDADAHHLRTFGRTGVGPGELGNPERVAIRGGRIWVADRVRPEVLMFDSSGDFLAALRPAPGCEKGNVVALAASVEGLYLLRVCSELPRRIRYRLERAPGPGESVTLVLDAVAHVVEVSAGGAAPMHFPALVAWHGSVLVGEGSQGCFTLLHTRSGEREADCFTGVARSPLPAAERARLSARWGGRVAVPDSLPLFRDLAVVAGALALHRPLSTDSSAWIELEPAPPFATTGRQWGPLGSGSFGGPMGILETFDGVEGTILRVLQHPRDP